MIIKLAGRAHCDPNETSEFGSCTTPATLGQIRADRDCSAPHLRRKAEHLVLREFSACCVKLKSQLMGEFPDLQISVIPHCSLRKLLSTKNQIPITCFKTPSHNSFPQAGA